MLEGRLLVATPKLSGTFFERTVILLLDHAEHGVLGVVLNRPSDVPVAEAVSRWEDLITPPQVLFVGGPVGEDAVVCLGRVHGDVATVDLDEPADDVEDIRLFRGYAGWDAGQLEAEIADGAWFVVDAEPEDVLSSDPDGLWRRVLRRQGGELAWFADYPLHPSMN